MAGFGNILDREAVKISSERQDERYLHQLGWLNLDRSNLNPPFCPKPRVSGHLHDDKQEKGNRVERVGSAHPESDIDGRDDDEDPEAYRKAQHLRTCPRPE